jgi:isoleucyl-tRNA synthetase
MIECKSWDNLKFDLEGIAEVRRKFLAPLYNTYSFFSLYANIDGFKYDEAEIPLKERPEIDQWIISELNTLIKDVDGFYADYEPTKAARAISDFVQENLSNWYVCAEDVSGKENMHKIKLQLSNVIYLPINGK